MPVEWCPSMRHWCVHFKFSNQVRKNRNINTEVWIVVDHWHHHVRAPLQAIREHQANQRRRNNFSNHCWSNDFSVYKSNKKEQPHGTEISDWFSFRFLSFWSCNDDSVYSQLQTFRPMFFRKKVHPPLMLSVSSFSFLILHFCRWSSHLLLFFALLFLLLLLCDLEAWKIQFRIKEKRNGYRLFINSCVVKLSEAIFEYVQVQLEALHVLSFHYPILEPNQQFVPPDCISFHRCFDECSTVHFAIDRSSYVDWLECHWCLSRACWSLANDLLPKLKQRKTIESIRWNNQRRLTFFIIWFVNKRFCPIVGRWVHIRGWMSSSW